MGDAAVKMTTLNLSMPSPPRTVGPRPEQWDETRSVFPIYIALAKQLTLEIPFASDKRILPEKGDADLYTKIQTWLDSMYQLRHLLQMTTLNASEAGLRALIQRHLRKPSKSNMDRDKVDFLLAQYFALCAPPKVYHKQIELEDVAQVMKPVLGEVSTAPISWCEPLEKMIVALRGFRSLRDVLKTSFVEQGRKVKDEAGKMFYEPAPLVAFVRFNFLMRRTLIELMHADLIATRAGLSQLDSLDVKAIDCRLFGLSPSEPIPHVRQLADEWKQPFQQEYTERTVNEAFEKLLCLRTDVEKALEKISPKAAESLTQAPQAREAEAAAAPTRAVAKEPAKSGNAPGVLDFES